MDKYKSFEELRTKELPKSYEIKVCDRSSKLLLLHRMVAALSLAHLK